jgi:hypothetical protein
MLMVLVVTEVAAQAEQGFLVLEILVEAQAELVFTIQ